MKIQCDVCVTELASVFCTADEAALCQGCDHKVHHANKLAQKHWRFSLHHPSRKESPSCDICQEKRAFLFCREDRAILCRECDVSIHQANEQVQNHSRFLLSGVKLSASSSTYHLISSSPPSSGHDSNSKHKARNSKSTSRSKATTNSSDQDQMLQGSCESSSVSNSASYISEYLGTLPGWDVEAFFDPSPNYYTFC